MEFVRKVMDSDSLASFMDLPKELKHKKVEVIILPIEEEVESKKVTKSLRGILNKYSNTELIDKEDDAWKLAVKEKNLKLF